MILIHKTRLFFVVLSLGLVSACALAPKQPAASDTSAVPAYTVVNRRDTFELTAATRRIVIRNRHGDLRLRSSDHRAVGVYSVYQRIEPTPLDPILETSQSGDTFVLTVRYPGEDGWAPDDHRRGRTDLGIWLPPDLALDIETTDGLVQLKRANAPVRIRTTSGEIEVSVGADLDVESNSGRITARQVSGNWSGTARVVTGKGSILAAVPAFANVHLIAESTGTLGADPGLPVPISGTPGAMRADVRYGSGQNLLELRAGGDVYLVPVIRDPLRPES